MAPALTTSVQDRVERLRPRPGHHEGQARWTQVRTAIGPITPRLWGDLPAEAPAAAGRVLGIVLDRANAVLVGP
jgi:hypothetical protein